MAKHQKKKARPSWFQKQIERGGEEFLLRKPPLDIQREAFNIVRDIARGNITQKDFKYLFTTKILSNVKITFLNKYIEYHTYSSAITMCINSSNGIDILSQTYGVASDSLQNAYNNSSNLCTSYGLVLQSIDYMMSAIQQNYPDDNSRHYSYIQVYNTIQGHLSRFKHII